MVVGHAALPPWAPDPTADISFPTPQDFLVDLELPEDQWHTARAETSERTAKGPVRKTSVLVDSVVVLTWTSSNGPAAVATTPGGMVGITSAARRNPRRGSPMTTQCTTTTGWPTTRILFALAGTVTLVSALLAATLTPWFLLLTGLVGLNQLVLVAFGRCPASVVIDHLRRPATR